MSSDKEIEYHKKIISDLNRKLNQDLVSVESFFYQALILHFKNGYKLIINYSENKHKSSVWADGLMMIYDKNFRKLRHYLDTGKAGTDIEDGSIYLKNIIDAFSKESAIKSKAFSNYYNLHQYELRSLLSNGFGLGFDPGREFFLYGNDEFRPRFEQASPILVDENGVSVIIEDKSALIFNSGDNRSIDISSGINYMDDKYIYTGKIFTEVRCKKSDPGSKTVRYNSKTKKKTYYKRVLKEGIDLSKEDRIEYKKANNMEFVLKSKNGIYWLEDIDGKIAIGHPDLLVYVLDK